MPNLVPKLVHDYIAIFHITNYLGLQWRNRLTPQHLSELTGQTIVAMMRISVLIKPFLPDQQILNNMHEGDGFSAETVGKSSLLWVCLVKITGPAIVWLASSDFWKVPLESHLIWWVAGSNLAKVKNDYSCSNKLNNKSKNLKLISRYLEWIPLSLHRKAH